jgi:hypothetical protein
MPSVLMKIIHQRDCSKAVSSTVDINIIHQIAAINAECTRLHGVMIEVALVWPISKNLRKHTYPSFTFFMVFSIILCYDF